MRAKRIILTLIIAIPTITNAQEKADSILQQNQELIKFLSTSNVSTQIFLGYQYLDKGTTSSNEFTVKRGYITFKKDLNKYLSGRITPDLTVDKEGDGLGDLEMRLKYCYIDFHTKGNFWIFTNPSFLAGEVFTPWLHFEEKINHYRIQGPQFLDVIKILSSADFGVTSTMLLGGEVNKDYQENVSKDYPGKYGSIAFGIYNGGGYHSIENNNNKTFQWRVSLRPFPSAITGLQFSYLGAYGKGNTVLNPTWNTQAGAISYQNRKVNLLGQAYTSVGNHSGSYADSLGNAYNSKGWSVFAEYLMIHNKISLFSRYDYSTIDAVSENINTEQFVFGIAYHIYKQNKVVVDYNKQKSNSTKINLFEVLFELAL